MMASEQENERKKELQIPCLNVKAEIEIAGVIESNLRTLNLIGLNYSYIHCKIFKGMIL